MSPRPPTPSALAAWPGAARPCCCWRLRYSACSPRRSILLKPDGPGLEGTAPVARPWRGRRIERTLLDLAQSPSCYVVLCFIKKLATEKTMRSYLCWAIMGALLLAGPARAENTVPSAEFQEILIKTSLLTLNDANLTGNYAVLHAKLAKVFRDQITPDGLKKGFKPFADQK